MFPRRQGVAVLTRRASGVRAAGDLASVCAMRGYTVSADGRGCWLDLSGDASAACAATGQTYDPSRVTCVGTPTAGTSTADVRAANQAACLAGGGSWDDASGTCRSGGGGGETTPATPDTAAEARAKTPPDPATVQAIANDATKVGLSVGADIVTLVNADTANTLAVELAQIGVQADQIRADATLNSQQSAERIAQLRAQADQAIQIAQQQTRRQVAQYAAVAAGSMGTTVMVIGVGALLLGGIYLATRDRR